MQNFLRAGLLLPLLLVLALFQAANATTTLKQNAEHLYNSPFTGGHVAVEGERLYVGAYGAGMRIFDISNPASPQQIGGYLPGERADAVPDAAVFDGRHIAVLNGTRRVSGPVMEIRTDRSEFLDVTDPANPVLLHTFIGQEDGEAHNGDIVDERRLWLPSGGSGAQGLRIYDLNPLLESPARAPTNLFRGDPTALWEASPYRGDRPVGAAFSHTHDITVYTDYPVAGLGPRDIVLLAEGGSYINNAGNTGSAFVIDITDPENPVVLLRWLHEQGEGHHPIRYHHEAQFLDGDPRVMLVTDEDLHNGCGGAGGVVAVRLSDDLTQATELSEWFVPAGTPAPICSVHVFSSHGNLVYIGSYNAGLQVVDYSDPANPRQVGHAIEPGTTAWGALYHNGYVYVGDMSRGLDVFRYTGPQPDVTLTAQDISFSQEKIKGGSQVTIHATIHNVGGVGASGTTVRFLDNGQPIGSDQRLGSIPAGESATASVVWDTSRIKGERTITVIVDPANEIDEGDEGNNRAERVVTVKGNRVRNSSFESSSSGSAPDNWSSSGETSRTSGGSDGQWSVTAGPGGSWLSDPIAVEAGRSYELTVDSSGLDGQIAVEQLSATGELLATTVQLLPVGDSTFQSVTSTVTVAEGVSEVRIRLSGGLTGSTTFDNVGLWD